MKFKIRHADKIVGLFIVIALLFLVVVIFLLGSKQNWFAKRYYYVAVLESASGVGENMPVLYKGFNIGNVDSVRLNDDDMVEVRFHILENYRDRVREGALVDVMVSPIGLGNQFFFYPGTGDELEEDSLIPAMNSSEGRQLIAQGLSKVYYEDDSISSLIAKVNTILENTNMVLLEVDAAIYGTDDTSLGRAIGKAETTLTDVSAIATNLSNSMESVLKDAKLLMNDAKKVLSDTEVITRQMSNPDGTLLSVLDAEGQIFKDLEKTLSSMSKTLENMEKTTSVLPAQAPNIAGLIEELRATMKDAEDVLGSLKNNPLLKKGIPDKVDTGSGGTSPRNVDF